ncbi:MAG TPA: FlgO family outer membrane protein [Spirochaetota bacterium]|nr:FlgO family outer membrane protein [Spirochaetota bacterium]HPI87961.1 FlgO family outer membrane protein [Spirochaetota bacterium]HPR46672.1 FlgO family outer membrane protein [Spirochaetota bacterium]
MKHLLKLVLIIFTIQTALQAGFTQEKNPGKAAKALNLRLTTIAGNKIKKGSTIAVLPFKHTDGSYSEFSNYFASEIISAMSEMNTFKPLERDQIDTLFNEIVFSASGAIDNSTMAEAGKMKGADAMLIGDIAVMSKNVIINARLVSVEKAETLSSAKVEIKMNSDIKRMMANIIKSDKKTEEASQGDIKPAEASLESQFYDDFEISVLRCYRQSNQVIVELRVSNLAAKPRVLHIYPEQSRMIDGDGETYSRPYIKFNESERNWGEVQGEVENGIPMPFKLTFKEMPDNITIIQLLQIGFPYDGKVKFKKVPVQDKK